MKKSMHPALVELMGSPEALRAQARFVALARGMKDDGTAHRDLVRGLAGAICRLLDDEYMKGDSEFLEAKLLARELRNGFADWADHLDKVDELVADVAKEMKRSRAAGGTGDPYQ